MKKPFRFYKTGACRIFERVLLPLILTGYFQPSFSQCTILDTAVQSISYTYVQGGGTNASGVAYNPDFNIYYAVIAGNPGFPYETFDATGVSLYQTIPGFDFRGLWWNPNTSEVEGNGFDTYGLWTSDLDINGYALSTGTNLFIGLHQPDVQSCGDYDYDANEIIYYFNGNIFRFDRSTDTFIGSYPLTGSPVPITKINITSVVYTGCCGNEIGVEDFVNKTILLFNKATGAYSGTSQLPATAVTNYNFRFSYANNLAWLYDVNTRTWTSYSIFSGGPGSTEVDLGNDTTLCIGSSLVLKSGNSAFQYLWSTGSTDSTITVDTAGIYWLTVTNGNCFASDTIIIADSLCTLVAFNSSDTSLCEKFCINFADSSLNSPIAWQWFFPGASPSSSSDQNPQNICYNDPGTYDVTLITTSLTGNDTLTLTGYVTVYATPPPPTITQNGYQLTSSAGDAYQWQYNAVDIPGATNQSYSVTQTGLYTVIVSEVHGCKNSVSQYVTISGIASMDMGMNLIGFPNPNRGSFMIEVFNGVGGEDILLSIQNALGQIVYASDEKITGDHWKTEIDISGNASGIYFLEIRSADGYYKYKMVVTK